MNDRTRIENFIKERLKLVSRDVDSLFTPDISLVPKIDYSDVVEKTRKAYPGAKDDLQALVFCAKHQEMSIKNAKIKIGKIFEEDYKKMYADKWLDRFKEYHEIY